MTGAPAHQPKEIVEDAGTAFAFPSSSIHVETFPGAAPGNFVPPGDARPSRSPPPPAQKTPSKTTIGAAEVNRVVKDLPALGASEDAIRARIAGKSIAVFLDFDGTLAAITDRPEKSLPAPSMRAAVGALAQACPVAIISGRDRADVAERVGLDTLIYAGSHGMDIAGPDGAHTRNEDRSRFLAPLEEIVRRLRRDLDTADGVMIEHKWCSVAVHFRRAPDAHAGTAATAVQRAVSDHPGFRIVRGRKVLEIMPRVDWDKGKAVLWLLDVLGIAGADMVPVYVGDDITDEDAFIAIDGSGIGVLVGDGAAEVGGRPTAADYHAAGLDDVESFLRFLAGHASGGP